MVGVSDIVFGVKALGSLAGVHEMALEIGKGASMALSVCWLTDFDSVAADGLDDWGAGRFDRTGGSKAMRLTAVDFNEMDVGIIERRLAGKLSTDSIMAVMPKASKAASALTVRGFGVFKVHRPCDVSPSCDSLHRKAALSS